MPETRPTTVVVSPLKTLSTFGLYELLSNEPGIALLQSALGNTLERLVAQGHDRYVVIVDDSVDYSSLARLKNGKRPVGLVVVTYAPTTLYGTLLLALGVACVAHDAPCSEILDAIRSVAEQKPAFWEGKGHRQEPRYPEHLTSLTRREQDVLRHLSAGQTLSQIALSLNIALETVRTHTASVRKKLGVTNKRDLIGLPLPTDYHPRSS
jgi:DNA-binding NarL/FixJ family response regulator